MGVDRGRLKLGAMCFIILSTPALSVRYETEPKIGPGPSLALLVAPGLR